VSLPTKKRLIGAAFVDFVSFSFDDQSHKAEIAAGFIVFDGVPFAARAKHGVTGFDGDFLPVIAVEALTFKNVVGFAFPVVFVIAEGTSWLQGYPGVEPAFSGKFFFAEQWFNKDVSLAASALFIAVDWSIGLPDFLCI